MTDLEVFVKMNELDVQNGTQSLGMCYHYAGVRKTMNGAVIEMGMPEPEMHKVITGERIPVLVLIDRAEFFKIKNNR